MQAGEASHHGSPVGFRQVPVEQDHSKPLIGNSRAGLFQVFGDGQVPAVVMRQVRDELPLARI